MKKTHRSVGATALAFVICLSVAAPAFARGEHRGPRDFRERVVRFITKIIAGISTNNDGLTPPRP